jgi:hypothetical protein
VPRAHRGRLGLERGQLVLQRALHRLAQIALGQQRQQRDGRGLLVLFLFCVSFSR